MYKRDDLIKECASQRWARFKLKKYKDGRKRNGALQEIFSALDSWILSNLTKGKGARIPNFGIFSWDLKSRLPVFKPADSFLKTFGVVSEFGQVNLEKMEKYLAKSQEINYSRLAINFSDNFTKDVMFCAIRDMLLRMGRACSKSREIKVKIAFSFGTFLCKRHRVSFHFSPEFKFENAKQICDEEEVQYLLSTQNDLENEEVEDEQVYEEEKEKEEEEEEGEEEEVQGKYPSEAYVNQTYNWADDEEDDVHDESLTSSLHFATSCPIKYRGDGEVAKRKRNKVLADAYQRHLGSVTKDIHAQNLRLENEMQVFNELQAEESDKLVNRLRQKKHIQKSLQEQIQARDKQREEKEQDEKSEKLQLYPPLDSFDLDMMESVEQEVAEEYGEYREEGQRFRARTRSTSTNRLRNEKPPLSTEQRILRAQRKDDLNRKKDHGQYLKRQMSVKKMQEEKQKAQKKIHEKKFLRQLHRSALKVEHGSKKDQEQRQKELMEAWQKDCSVRQKYRERKDSLQAVRRQFIHANSPNESKSNFSSVGFDVRTS